MSDPICLTILWGCANVKKIFIDPEKQRCEAWSTSGGKARKILKQILKKRPKAFVKKQKFSVCSKTMTKNQKDFRLLDKMNTEITVTVK